MTSRIENAVFALWPLPRCVFPQVSVPGGFFPHGFNVMALGTESCTRADEPLMAT